MKFLKMNRAFIGTIILAVVIAFVPTLFADKFYLRDDMQHYHLPTFFHMGDMLWHGEFPFLTLSSWHGGNLLGEHQNAVYNPVSLLTYLVLPFAPDYELAATVLALFYYAIFATGIFTLCRTYHVPEGWSVLCATAAVTNGFIAYYYSQSWFGVFISLCWLSWGWAMLPRAGTSIGAFFGSIVACYLTITAGWPHTTLVLAGITLLIGFERFVRREHWQTIFYPLMAAGIAALLAAPALLPLLSLKEVVSRASGFWNNGFLVPSLFDALSVSAPFYRGFLSWWGGFRLTSTPHYYVAWFILPLLPFIAWKKVDWRAPGILTLLCATGLFFLALRGPEQMGPLRWSIRFLPLFQISLLVLCIRIVAMAGLQGFSWRRMSVALGITGVLTLGTIQSSPEDANLAIAGAVFLIGATAISIAVTQRWRVTFFTVSTITMGLANFWLYPNLFEIWAVPTRVETERIGMRFPTSYLFNNGSFINSTDPERYEEYQTGQIPLLGNAAFINGYTPLGHELFEQLTCMGIQGKSCPAGALAVLAEDPETRVPLVDLMRIDTIVSEHGEWNDITLPLLNEGWTIEEGKFSTRATRALPNSDLPGNLSFTSPEAVVTSVRQPTIRNESLQIDSEKSTTLIFARLYWPGYKAFLDGEQIPIIRHRGFLVRIDVPEGSGKRIIELTWQPPFLRSGLAIAFLGLILSVLLAAPMRRHMVK